VARHPDLGTGLTNRTSAEPQRQTGGPTHDGVRGPTAGCRELAQKHGPRRSVRTIPDALKSFATKTGDSHAKPPSRKDDNAQTENLIHRVMANPVEREGSQVRVLDQRVLCAIIFAAWRLGVRSFSRNPPSQNFRAKPTARLTYCARPESLKDTTHECGPNNATRTKPLNSHRFTTQIEEKPVWTLSEFADRTVMVRTRTEPDQQRPPRRFSEEPKCQIGIDA
jgi:hypothetical protein